MKKISSLPIFFFFGIFSISILFCLTLTYLLLYKIIHLPLEYEFIYFIFFSLLFYSVMIINLRVWLYFFPTPIGVVSENDKWHLHTYQLFYLIMINPITLSRILPIPLMRAFYQCLGAKMGDNSYCGGTMADAHLIKMGSNCIIGDNALLTPHQHEAHVLAHYPIILGNNVTVSAHAMLLAGVIIEDNSIVAAGAIVLKGTHIKKGEVWGGVPARLLYCNDSRNVI